MRSGECASTGLRRDRPPQASSFNFVGQQMISPSAGGDDVFAVKISATVEWYEWDPETPGGGSWIYAGQTGFSAIISIVDCW